MNATEVNLKLVLVGNFGIGRLAIVERYMTGTLSCYDYSHQGSYFRFNCGYKDELGV